MEIHWIVFFLEFCFEIVSGFDPVKCLKNDDYGNHPQNIYYCRDEREPECCHKDNTFSCCQTESHRALIQQLQLWGGLAGIIACMVIAYLCYRSDPYICEGKTVKERCQDCCVCVKSTKSDDVDIVLVELDKRGFNRSQSYRIKTEERRSYSSNIEIREKTSLSLTSTYNGSPTNMANINFTTDTPGPTAYKCPICHGPTPCDQIITKL